MTEHLQNELPQRGIGLFSTAEPLEQAINNLKAENFDLSHLSVIARGIAKTEKADEAIQVSDRVGDQSVASSTGIVTDAVRGATWGSLLAGISSFAIPGVGAVVAAGSVGVALLTGLAGTGLSLANFNNLVKAFTELGVAEEDAKVYSERLSNGNYLVIVEGTANEIQQAGAAFINSGIEGWNTYSMAA